MNLPVYSLENKKIIYFFLAVMLIGGIYSFFKLPKKEDSPFVIKQAVLVTQYPGATPQEVEKLITEPIEREIQSMSDVFQIKSESYFGMSKISIELQPTLAPDYMPVKWDELRRKVANIQPRLPSGASAINVSDDFGDVFGIYYALTADEGFTYDDMRDWAQKIKTELTPIQGVQKVYLFAEQTQVVNVRISVPKLANLGIDPNSIQQVLQTQNLLVNTGEIMTGTYQLRVRAEGTYKSIEDIREQLIVTKGGGEVRLGDIAIIERGYMDPPSNLMRVDGKRAIGIGVATGAKDDVVAVGDAVAEHLKEMEQLFPIGMELKTIYPENQIANEANNGFILNLIESLLIVIVIIFLVMGSRAGMLVGSSLLFSVGGTLLMMLIWGVGLNRTSLAAFIIAMGMLVDNAIVVTDNAQVGIKRGLSRYQALVDGATKPQWALLGATFIAVCSFLPMYLAPASVAEIVKPLFIVLAVSLGLSWILALTQIPMHADRFLKVKARKDKDLFDSPIYRKFRTLLSYMLWHKKLAIGVTVLLLGLSVYLYRYIPQGFFPDLSYSQLYIEYSMSEGTRTERLKADLEKVEKYLLSYPGITHVTTSIGGTPSRYNLVRSIAEPSMSYGELIVDYTDPDALKASIPVLQEELTQNFPDAYVRIKRYNLMYEKFPVELMFTGPDPAVLKELSAKAERIMKDEPSAMLVRNDWEPMKPVLTVDYHQPVARTAGLSRSDIGVSMLAATDGMPVGSFYEGTHSLPIYIKSVDNKGEKLESLNNIPVWSMMPSMAAISGETLKGLLMGTIKSEELLSETIGSIPLNQATRGIQICWEDPVVRRYNGQRAIKAQCNNAPGHTAAEVRAALMEKTDTITLPEGYSKQWLGEYRASSESTKYLFRSLPWAVILMVAILIMLFKDFKKPAIILLCLPLAIIGIVFGMLLSGKDFGFVAIVGALGLIGMMIKNGVVLLDEITLQIQSGKEPHQALLDSSSSRFRPVMMASLTTIVGMIPLLGDDLFGSLAVTIMSGLLIGSVITLVFIPVLFSLFFHIKGKRQE